jgi:hypothetical protein
MDVSRSLSMADWPQEHRDPRPITRRISKTRANRRLVENVGELERRGYPRALSIAQTKHLAARRAAAARYAAPRLARVAERLRTLQPATSEWQPYPAIPARDVAAEIAAENALEARKVARRPEDKPQTRYPIVWVSRPDPSPRCECEASFEARALHRWLEQREQQTCHVEDVPAEPHQLWDGVQRNVPVDPPALTSGLDLGAARAALRVMKNCPAKIHFPASIDQTAIGRTTTTVRGMPGRTIERLEISKHSTIQLSPRPDSWEIRRLRRFAREGTPGLGFTTIEMPGPFELAEALTWERDMPVALQAPPIAAHEGYETDRGYRVNPAWRSDPERLEREYAEVRRIDINAPLERDNILLDDEGRIVLGLSQYEYFRRKLEASKRFPDGRPVPNPMAVGTYMPRKTWRAFYDSHQAHTKKLQERAKLERYVTNLGHDLMQNDLRGRIARLTESERDQHIKTLYRKHHERGLAHLL